jgi:hypothetical protein
VSARRSRGFVWLGVAFVLIVLFAAWPLLSVMLASGMAGALGCALNEGGASPCLFMGTDIGETLVVMFVLGWFAFWTLPLGAVALVAWLVIACVATLLGWRRRREA